MYESDLEAGEDELTCNKKICRILKQCFIVQHVHFNNLINDAEIYYVMRAVTIMIIARDGFYLFSARLQGFCFSGTIAARYPIMCRRRKFGHLEPVKGRV
jgi:hypothetical protein